MKLSGLIFLSLLSVRSLAGEIALTLMSPSESVAPGSVTQVDLLAINANGLSAPAELPSRLFGRLTISGIGHAIELGARDYFRVPEERIKRIESVLTVLGGAVVHATEEFSTQAPHGLSAMPDWAPSHHFGGYGAPKYYANQINGSAASHPAGCTCPVHETHPVGCTYPSHAFNATNVLARLLCQATAPADRALGGASAPNGVRHRLRSLRVLRTLGYPQRKHA